MRAAPRTFQYLKTTGTSLLFASLGLWLAPVGTSAQAWPVGMGSLAPLKAPVKLREAQGGDSAIRNGTNAVTASSAPRRLRKNSFQLQTVGALGIIEQNKRVDANALYSSVSLNYLRHFGKKTGWDFGVLATLGPTWIPGFALALRPKLEFGPRLIIAPTLKIGFAWTELVMATSYRINSKIWIHAAGGIQLSFFAWMYRTSLGACHMFTDRFGLQYTVGMNFHPDRRKLNGEDIDSLPPNLRPTSYYVPYLALSPILRF